MNNQNRNFSDQLLAACTFTLCVFGAVLLGVIIGQHLAKTQVPAPTVLTQPDTLYTQADRQALQWDVDIAPTEEFFGLVHPPRLIEVPNLSIGVVTIDTTTGAVTIDDGASLPEAARQFWRSVAETYPEVRAAMMKEAR